MKISRMKRLRKGHRYLNALLVENPVLVLGLDLPFVIATTVSVRGAAAMSVEMFIIHMGTLVAAMLVGRHIGGWAKFMFTVSVSTVLMAFSRLLLIYMFRGITDVLGMYIYLMAVNGMTLVQANSTDKKSRYGPVLVSAFMNAAGFSLTVFGVSLLREWLGSGTIWGHTVPVPVRLPGVLIPFCGFLIMGFLLAGARFLNKKTLVLSMMRRSRKTARFQALSGK